MSSNNVQLERKFALWKSNALSKLDKSTIGSIDPKIRELCDSINERSDMFTLSSCSGRISLCLDHRQGKRQNIWKFVSHDLVNYEEMIESVYKLQREEEETQEEQGLLFFRQESAIVHICCSTFELARSLMHIAKSCGFNLCGIIACKTKIVVEIICDATLVVPIYEKSLLVSESYLDNYLLNIANENLQKSWNCINKLNELLSTVHGRDEAETEQNE
eukprot:TRINITY_DN2062_c1_g2_i1.p1 TRINITY_DN2062_c1_g2~~TRINITY_DN2062_c1_g2_i1.p1  ORF type:complete len:218 (+),score=57.59 TRINITY_DN2062_c1_g2_i1:43-696(+)